MCSALNIYLVPVKHTKEIDRKEFTSLDHYMPVSLLDMNPSADPGLEEIMNWVEDHKKEAVQGDPGKYFIVSIDCNFYFRWLKVRNSKYY